MCGFHEHQGASTSVLYKGVVTACEAAKLRVRIHRSLRVFGVGGVSLPALRQSTAAVLTLLHTRVQLALLENA